MEIIHGKAVEKIGEIASVLGNLIGDSMIHLQQRMEKMVADLATSIPSPGGGGYDGRSSYWKCLMKDHAWS